MPIANIANKQIIYYVGEKRLVWENAIDDDNTILTPTTASASVYDISGTEIATLTVTKSAGLMEATITETAITSIGRYRIEWTFTYTRDSLTAIKKVITDVIATKRDNTTLMGYVPRMRVWINDNPSDPSKRIANDLQLKTFLVEAVRLYMDDYTITTTAGVEDITTAPTAESDDENLIILWGSYMYLTLGSEAIAREQTTLFTISYDQAYRVLQDKINLIYNKIKELDPNARIAITGESDIEAWGQAMQRTWDAIATWDET